MNTSFDPTQQLRAKHEKNLANARNNALMAIVLSLVSVVTIAAAEINFFFSAYLPNWLMFEGMVDLKINQDLTMFAVYTVAAVLICAILLLCWYLSKKNYVWLVVLGILFLADTAFMLPYIFNYYLEYALSDAIFLLVYHAWILVSLTCGIISGNKLSKLPPPPVVFEGEAAESMSVEDFNRQTEENATVNSQSDFTED